MSTAATLPESTDLTVSVATAEAAPSLPVQGPSSPAFSRAGRMDRVATALRRRGDGTVAELGVRIERDGITSHEPAVLRLATAATEAGAPTAVVEALVDRNLPEVLRVRAFASAARHVEPLG
jgi:hypothetical protein